MKLFTKILLSAFLVVCFFQGYANGSVRLRAEPDTFTVLQATVDTFAVTAVDSIPAGDSVCISLIGSPPGFSVLDCHSIIFRPDSTFTGRDTCRYALCDTAGICDTAMVVVYVNTNPALWPVVSFYEDTSFSWIYPGRHELFVGTNCYAFTCVDYQLVNTSTNFDSIRWQVSNVNPYCKDTLHYSADTILVASDSFRCSVPRIMVCLTAYNQFGSMTICDTSCQIEVCEGIAEVPLANIHIYPDPADRVLTIDMRQNTDPISVSYTAIHVYDKLGQKVRSIPRHDSSRMVEIPVAFLPDGIYLSTITDARGTEMMLGRFTVMK